MHYYKEIELCVDQKTMYESNNVLNVAHHLFKVCLFCRIRQRSLPTSLINSSCIFKVSTVKWPFGVNPLPNECTAVSKTAPFTGGPCSDAERCTPFILSPWRWSLYGWNGVHWHRAHLWPLQSMFQGQRISDSNRVNSASFNVQTELKEYWSYDHYENVPKLSLTDRIVILVKETRLHIVNCSERSREL